MAVPLVFRRTCTVLVPLLVPQRAPPARAERASSSSVDTARKKRGPPDLRGSEKGLGRGGQTHAIVEHMEHMWDIYMEN